MRSSVLLMLLPTLAFARAGGIVSPQCLACHGGGGSASIAVAPATFTPGQTATVTVTITGGGANGGLYLFANGGLFANIAGQGTRLFNNEVLHSVPGAAQTCQARRARRRPSEDRAAARFDCRSGSWRACG